MIWHYFPIGMRFPVTDFSDETKRACWQIALSAIYASDPKGTGLYEACEPFDPVSNGPVYTCIVCYYGVKQSRPAGKTMHALSRLTARLCLYHPLVQANYLEAFGPYPLLGRIDETGTLVPEPDGAAFLPTEAVIPMPVSDGPELLLALADEDDPEQLTRVFGTAAADRGFCVKRMPLPTGNRGAVQALLDACGGRYEMLKCEDVNGKRVKRTIGILPGSETVIEADGSVPAAQMIRKALDLGCRRITVVGGEQATDTPEDERLAGTALTFLPDGEAWAVNRIDLSDAAKTAAHIITNRPALFGGDPRVIAVSDADGLLTALQGLGKGVANAPGL